MTIKRYECITEWGGTNYDATPTDDGPWVSYDDHAKEIADLRALAREAVKEAYAEAFDDAVGAFTTFSGVLDEDLIQECWLKSGAACREALNEAYAEALCDFKDGDE
jgi:hypothetical protein